MVLGRPFLVLSPVRLMVLPSTSVHFSREISSLRAPVSINSLTAAP